MKDDEFMPAPQGDEAVENLTDGELAELLDVLAKRTVEAAPTELAENIKRQIPPKFGTHRGGLGTVNIIIDLRISKLAAAAAIIITLVLFANFLRDKDTSAEDIYQDSKLLVKYCLGGVNGGRKDVLTGFSNFYQYLIHEGREAAYYGDIIDPDDKNAIVLQWKLSDGEYKVIFADLSSKTVDADELIELQSRMLLRKTK
jgi:hypothetical protein